MASQSGLNKQEVNLISSIIDLRDKPILSILKPMNKVFMVSGQKKLNSSLLQKVADKGYSLIPVYRDKNKNDVIGTIKAKELLLLDE